VSILSDLLNRKDLTEKSIRDIEDKLRRLNAARNERLFALDRIREAIHSIQPYKPERDTK
jgi:hypothetical protein